MPQVPYNPVPSVAPQMNPTPTMGISVPADAFGANVAAATQHLGKVLDHAGGEIFERGIAMQKLANETEAKQADADYIIKVGELHADYQSKSGLEAVRGYQPFVDSLRTLREDYSSKMSNPESRRMFDAASLGTMSRTLFSGAGHSATENKRASLGASEARVSAAGNVALTQPDADSFKQALGITQAEVRSQANLLGWDEDKTANELRQKTSELWEKRIQGMSKNNPFSAKKLLDEATKDGHLSGEANGRMVDYVNKALYTVGARNISASISSGGNLSFGERVVPITAAKMAIAGFESGGNYKAVGPVTKSGDRAYGKYQTMGKNVPGWLAEAGLPQMSLEEYLNNPDAQEAVFETIFGKYMKETGTFNDAASKWFSGKTRAQASGNEKDVNNTTIPSYLANTNAILAKNATLADRVAVGRAEAEKISPDDKLFPDYVQERITIDNNRAIAIKRDAEFQHKQTIEAALVSGGLKGELPTTVEELKASSPEVASAWDAALPSNQRSYMKILAQNAKGDTAWTDEKLRQFQQLKGQAMNDPVAFLDQDVISLDLPTSARKELIGLQGKIQKDSEGDPRIKRAVQILQPTLNAAGLDRRRDKDSYDQFVGALSDQLRLYTEENKKTPPPEEVQKMGARLLQLQSGTGYFGSNMGRVPLYQVPAPDSLVSKVQEQATKQGIPPPTADQIQREYTRQMYQTLYSKPAKPAASGSTPQVPTSR